MDELPEIDVIIVARNEARHISQCLEALLAQQGVKLRLFVFDHFSKDETFAQVSAIVANNPQVVVRQEAANSVAQLRNKALACGSGEYVAFLDAHTIVCTGWAQLLYQHLQQQDDRVVGVSALLEYSCRDQRVAEYLKHYSGFNEDTFFEYFLSGRFSHYPWLPTGAALFRRFALEEVGGFNESFFELEDAELSWRLVERGYQLGFAPSARALHYEDRSYWHFLRKLFRYGLASRRLHVAFGVTGNQISSHQINERDSWLLCLLLLSYRLACACATLITPSVEKNRKWSEQVISYANTNWSSDRMLNVASHCVYWPSDQAHSRYMLVDRRTGHRSELTGVGAFIWQCVTRGVDRDATVHALEQRYEAETHTLESDVDAFIAALIAEEILNTTST